MAADKEGWDGLDAAMRDFAQATSLVTVGRLLLFGAPQSVLAAFRLTACSRGECGTVTHTVRCAKVEAAMLTWAAEVDA